MPTSGLLALRSKNGDDSVSVVSSPEVVCRSNSCVVICAVIKELHRLLSDNRWRRCSFGSLRNVDAANCNAVNCGTSVHLSKGGVMLRESLPSNMVTSEVDNLTDCWPLPSMIVVGEFSCTGSCR